MVLCRRDSPRFACHSCGHLFNLPGQLWQFVRRLRGKKVLVCPKCGDDDIGVLMY